MVYPRQASASIIWNPDGTGSEKLWITGGVSNFDGPLEQDDRMTLVSTEFISLDAFPQFGPDLPNPTSSHCLVKLSPTMAFLIGGLVTYFDPTTYALTSIDRYPFTYFYTTETGWTAGPLLQRDRYNHVCGVLIDGGNQDKIVVTTGGMGNALHLETELLIVHQDLSWTIGPEFPLAINSANGVSTADGSMFIVVGALVSDVPTPDFIKEIYSMTCQDGQCHWTTMHQELETGREGAVAMLVPPTFCL